jgi:hypothetical protein
MKKHVPKPKFENARAAPGALVSRPAAGFGATSGRSSITEVLEAQAGSNPGLLRVGEDTSVAAGTTATGLLLERLLLGLGCCHLLIIGWLLHCHHLARLRLVGCPQPVPQHSQGADVASVLVRQAAYAASETATEGRGTGEQLDLHARRAH